jgi:hypothetical protein
MSHNDITGDRIATRTSTPMYQKGWDAIFGKKEPAPPSNGPRDCAEDPPAEPGQYNIVIPGIRTLIAIFWTYDGQKWHQDRFLTPNPLKKGDAFWYDNKGNA